MDQNPPKVEFRSYFERLRQEDVRCTPAFSQILSAPSRRSPTKLSASHWAAVAAILLGGIGIVLALHHLRATADVAVSSPVPASTVVAAPPSPLAATSICDWQSPTRFLLDTDDDLPFDENSVPLLFDGGPSSRPSPRSLQS